ncbi:hypothetical protein VNI00_006465 [Paramarasmius palmivorus]|uniref:Uncharacterized protein n=1 Tax=Paramarasmius palmivorus TaxID=297713 RepID=A0AAW0D9L3_9AGAR
MFAESYERSTRYTLPETINDTINHSPSVSPALIDLEVDPTIDTSVGFAEPELGQASKDAILRAFGASPIPAEANGTSTEANEESDDEHPATMSNAPSVIDYDSADRETVDVKHARMAIATHDFVTTPFPYLRNDYQPVICFCAKDVLAQVESMLMRGEDRKAPIPPTPLARLIEIGWISREELLGRLLSMDWAQLKKYMEHWDREQRAFVHTHGTHGQWGLNGRGRVGPPYRIVWTRSTTPIIEDNGVGQKGKGVKPPVLGYELDGKGTGEADPTVAFAISEDHLLARGRPPSAAYRKHLGETATSIWPWLDKYEAFHREQCSMTNEEQAKDNTEGKAVALKRSQSNVSLQLPNLAKALLVQQPTLDISSPPAKKDRSTEKLDVDGSAKEDRAPAPAPAPASPPKPPSLKEKVSIWLKVPLPSANVKLTPATSAPMSTSAAATAVAEPEVVTATNTEASPTTEAAPSAPLKIKISRKRKALEDEGEQPVVRKSNRVIKKPKRFTL